MSKRTLEFYFQRVTKLLKLAFAATGTAEVPSLPFPARPKQAQALLADTLNLSVVGSLWKLALQLLNLVLNAVNSCLCSLDGSCLRQARIDYGRARLKPGADVIGPTLPPTWEGKPAQ